MMNQLSTTWIISRAQQLGFPVVGVAPVEPMDPTPLRDWLAQGFGAEMDYLHRHLPLRANLHAVLSGAQSVICVALPYVGSTSGTVARYAQGIDYHDIVREMLQRLWDEIAAQCPSETARIFVDGGPLPERALAHRAGIGWIGKHGCLIHERLGSRFVLGEILTTLKLDSTLGNQESRCGGCQRCLHSCPTQALVAPGLVDARRCLSYLTIEHKGPIPREIRPLLESRLFGCDCCQDACPYNHKFAEIASPLRAYPGNDHIDLVELLQMTPQQFNARFRGTSLHRTKRRGLLRNACVVMGNSREAAFIPALREALRDEEVLIRGHAAWALGELGDGAGLASARNEERDAWVREEITGAIHKTGTE